MIKFNNSDIIDWNFDNSNIIKVYHNGAVCYYKLTSGDTPTPVQEPCFAVVDDITQYQETEFEDVFNQADGKWYKLNNLNQYEQYGIYGSGRTITTYEGKLTIDDGDDGDGEDYSTHYLSLVAQTDNVTFSYSTATSSNKLQYSVDGGSTWVDLGNNQSTSSINNGEKIMFKASGLTVNTERGIGKIIPSASASVEGNIMSLAYDDNFSGQTEIPNNFQFRKLFSGVTTITSAENMVLPATTIKGQCYSQMFQGCTSLTTAPTVIGSSAMTWSGDYCWSDMFNTCTSLVNPPKLPALNLGAQCYWYMFQNCSSLTRAPELLATTTATQCYNGMFSGCINLNYIKVLASSGFSMNEWVKNVGNTGTFVKSSAATFSSCGQNTYPCGWTVQDYVEPTPIKYEYIYSGGSWVNVGEVSGSTIDTVWIDPPSTNNQNASFAVGHYWGEGYKMIMNAYLSGSYSSDVGSFWRWNQHTPIEFNFYANGFYYDFHNPTSTTAPNVNTGDYSWRIMKNSTLSRYENSQIFNVILTNGTVRVELEDGTAIVTGSTSVSTQSWYNGLYQVDLGIMNPSNKCHTSRIQVYNTNDELVNDIKFVKNQGVTGSQEISAYDSVLNVTYNNTNSYTPSYHIVSESGGTEYPMYYPVMQDPPNNLVFNTMTEAEEYECPWVGMKATIDGDNYVFSGDAISGYEWVEVVLPYDAEIEYLESSGSQYINTNQYLNTSNFEVGYSVLGNRGYWGYVHNNVVNGAWVTVDETTAFFGSFNNADKVSVSSYISSTENTIVYTQSGATINGTTISKNFNLRGVDNLASVPLLFFALHDFYNNSLIYSNSKFKSFYLKNNGVLVRDMIPVRVGQVGYMYDRVSGQLFGNAGTGSFILGPDK